MTLDGESCSNSSSKKFVKRFRCENSHDEYRDSKAAEKNRTELATRLTSPMMRAICVHLLNTHNGEVKAAHESDHGKELKEAMERAAVEERKGAMETAAAEERKDAMEKVRSATVLVGNVVLPSLCRDRPLVPDN